MKSACIWLTLVTICVICCIADASSHARSSRGHDLSPRQAQPRSTIHDRKRRRLFTNYGLDESSRRQLRDTGINERWRRNSRQANGCGGNLSTSSGTIMSPNFPNNYPHSSDCSWLITLQERSIVQLTFSDMGIENCPVCRYDYVLLYDGPDDSSRLLGKLCERSAPLRVFSTSGRQMFIRFISDGSVSKRGFKATYTMHATGLGPVEPA